MHYLENYVTWKTEFLWKTANFEKLRYFENLLYLKNCVTGKLIFFWMIMLMEKLRWGALLVKYCVGVRYFKNFVSNCCVGVRYFKNFNHWIISRYFIWNKLYLRSIKRHEQCLIIFYYIITILNTIYKDYLLITNFACWWFHQWRGFVP